VIYSDEKNVFFLFWNSYLYGVSEMSMNKS
jgi:hypothetical protein